MCPGVTSLPAAAGTSCSNNGYCDGTGSCTCAGYAYGPACASYCQPQLSHNASVVCSGRGYCSGSGACTCYEGYYNTTCQSRCPQYLNQTCGGRGVCDPITGRCTCTGGGYAGVACELDCPGGATSPCYGRGLCVQDNATCNCFQSAAAGYFSGFSCESCSTLFTGPSCTVYCNPNFGTINGTSCVCTFGRYGISCDNLCPRGSTNQLVCSGHGVCDSVAGSCACSSNYYGTACDVLCTVAICQATGMYRPQCDTNNGSCVCKNSETGHWTGALCNTCASDRWGDECNLACSCNGHGSCNSLTGACICYNDNVQGHYSGTTCAVCDSKYFGSQCLNLNLNYSPASTVIVSLGAQVASLWAAVHRSDGIIVYGSGSDSALRVCTLIPANGSVACRVATAPSPSLSGFFLTTGPFSSSLVVLTLNGSAMNLVFESNGTVVGHDLLTSSSDVSPTASRTFSQLSANGNPHDLQSVHYVPVPNATVAEQSYCYVGLPINSSASNASATAQLSCLNASTFLPTRSLNISLASPWDAIVSVFWSTDRRQLAIVGCMNGCHSWVATIVTLNVTTTTEAAAIRGVVSVHTYENPSLTDSSLLACTSINVANFTLICSTQESTNEGLYLWSLTINSAAVLTATPSPLVVAQVYSGQLFASVNLSALSVLMTAEEEAQLAYVAFTPPYDFPIVLVLDAQTLQLNSIHSLTSFPSGVVASLSMDPANRLLIGSLYDAQGGLNVFTINLFSVSSVVPGVVDAVGGATLTISGYGFVGDVTRYSCVFEGAAQPSVATILNPQTALCVVPTTSSNSSNYTAGLLVTNSTTNASSSSVDSCDTQAVNIRYLDQAARSTRQVTAGLLRPTSATIDAITTAYGSVGFGSVNLPTTLTITGAGFVATSEAGCRFIPLESNGTTISSGGLAYLPLTPATVVNSTMVTCAYVAPHNASLQRDIVSGHWKLQYTHDGFAFGSSAPPFSFVGDAVGVAVSLMSNSGTSEVTHISADAVTVLGDLTVAVVDALGQARGHIEDVDATFREATCSAISVPHTTLQPRLVTFGNGSSTAVAGVFQSGSFVLSTTVYRPPAGILTISCTPSAASSHSFTPSTFASSLSITIVAGSPYRLNMTTMDSWSAQVYSTEVLAPEPSLWVEDAAGNEITDEALLPSSAMFAYSAYDAGVAAFVPTSTIASVTLASGRYVFSSLSVRTLFAVPVNISASLPAMPLVQGVNFVLSPELCLVTQVAVPNTTECTVCPQGAVCNGSSFVETVEGYWRAYTETLEFYSCTPPDSCPGGERCATGYTDRLCVLCQPGYGRSQTSCVRCPDERLSWGVIIAAIIIIYAVMLKITIFAMPATTAAEARALTNAQITSRSASIAVKVLVSHVQLLGFMEVPTRTDGTSSVPSWMTNTFTASSSGGSLDAFALVSCLGAATVYDKLVVLLIAIPAFVMMAVFFAGVRARREAKAAHHGLEHTNGMTLEYGHQAIQFDDPLSLNTSLNSGDISDPTMQRKRSWKTQDIIVNRRAPQRNPLSMISVATQSPLASDGGDDEDRDGVTTPLGSRTREAPRTHSSSSLSPFRKRRQQMEAQGQQMEAQGPTKEQSLSVQSVYSVIDSPTAPHVTGSRDNEDDNALPPSHSVSARRLRERRGVSVLNLSGEKIDSPHVTVPQATTSTLTSRFAGVLWKWDTLQRFVHMSLVAAVGILFFVYPMVVEYSTDVLDCVSIETSPGVTMRVMRLDPSVDCDSNEYTKMFVVSMAALVVCGVGVPALSVVAVHMVRKVSCDGELRPASAIFYFLTGGYRAERWYWEGISLTKKLLLVVVTSVVKDDALRLLSSLWIMTASLLLNAIAQPWEDALLARGEDVSFAVLVASFGAMYWLKVSGVLEGNEDHHQLEIVVVLIIVIALNAAALIRLISSVVAGAYADIIAAASERSSCALRAVDDAVSALNACLQDRTAKRCDDVQIDVVLHRSRRTALIDDTALTEAWRRMRRAARVMENEEFTARMAAAVAAHNPAQPPQGRGAFSSSDDDGSSGSDGMKRKRRTAKAKREVVSSEWEATDTFHILCVRVGRVLALRRCIAYMYRQQQTNYYQHTSSPHLSSDNDSDPQLAEEWLRALFRAETRLAMSIIQLTRGGNALREFLHDSAPLPPKTELAIRASTTPEDAGSNGSQQPITVHEERDQSHNSYQGRERSEASTHRSHNSNDDDVTDIEVIDYLDS